jgi:hypothetical protein
MKLLLIATFAVISLEAQPAAKLETQNTSAPPQAKIQERPLTPLEISDSLLANKTVQLEQAKIQESQRKISEAQRKYAELVQKACISIAIAPDKWTTECGFTNGLGQDDQQLTDQNGRPVAARVWKLPPPAAPEAPKQ